MHTTVREKVTSLARQVEKMAESQSLNPRNYSGKRNYQNVYLITDNVEISRGRPGKADVCL